MRALVLTYHSHNVWGVDYSANDHVSLACDLRTLNAIGARIVPLAQIVEALRSGLRGEDELVVSLTFDDGPVFDFADFEHPRFGPQRSFLNVMRDFVDEAGAAAQPELHATSFVIASPEARAAMERAPDCGYPVLSDWLADAWWREAAKTGLVDLGNHSWDHVHHAVPELAISVDARDDFARVDNYVDADREIRRAGDFIRSRAGGACDYFAYPFGHVNRYLVEDYMPCRRAEHGMSAAFGAQGRRIAPGDSVWNIPRAVCGYHWKTPDELRTLIAGDLPRD